MPEIVQFFRHAVVQVCTSNGEVLQSGPVSQEPGFGFEVEIGTATASAVISYRANDSTTAALGFAIAVVAILLFGLLVAVALAWH